MNREKVTSRPQLLFVVVGREKQKSLETEASTNTRRHILLHTDVKHTNEKSVTMKITSVALLGVIAVVNGQVQYGDRWNYDQTITRNDGFTDYGPSEWDNISCDESSQEGLDACLGYTDKWHTGQGWRIQQNTCRWCPEDSPGSCGRHHMSPINLERNRGLGYWGKTEENMGDPGANADPEAVECIDVHWMKYEVCSWWSE